ncbi:MAG: hypothetical protein Q9226_009004 [Calogaya cf. arnoldii]
MPGSSRPSGRSTNNRRSAAASKHVTFADSPPQQPAKKLTKRQRDAQRRQQLRAAKEREQAEEIGHIALSQDGVRNARRRKAEATRQRQEEENRIAEARCIEEARRNEETEAQTLQRHQQEEERRQEQEAAQRRREEEAAQRENELDISYTYRVKATIKEQLRRQNRVRWSATIINPTGVDWERGRFDTDLLDMKVGEALNKIDELDKDSITYKVLTRADHNRATWQHLEVDAISRENWYERIEAGVLDGEWRRWKKDSFKVIIEYYIKLTRSAILPIAGETPTRRRIGTRT